MLGEGQGEEELVFIKVNNVPGTLHLIHSKQESREVAKKKKGLPRWSNGQDCVSPLQGHRFDPSLGNQDPICPVEEPKIKFKKKKEAGQGFSKFYVHTNSLEDLVKLWTLESGAGVGAGVPHS